MHIGVGVISFDESGKVEFLNNAAKKLLKARFLDNINSLKKSNIELYNHLVSLKPNEKRIIKVADENDIYQVIFYTTIIRIKNKNFKIVSLQNIQSELEQQEIDAWQKLIRVLTHEIMNSVTPISSLAGTVNNILHDYTPGKRIDEDSINDVTKAITTIQKRSEGLLSFVNDYRSLTKVPKPKFEMVKINSLFSRVTELLESDLKEKKVELSYKVLPENLDILCDPALIEQVIINLILNSSQALQNTNQPEMSLVAALNARGKAIIRVSDNGSGMSEEVLDKIFIPFFSTKSEGSGIGLSLSKQIIISHGGSIRVQSSPNIRTVFTIEL
jgi:nitrogen fixation/metabolism regulation signal transduction histidine kinase